MCFYNFNSENERDTMLRLVVSVVSTIKFVNVNSSAQAYIRIKLSNLFKNKTFRKKSYAGSLYTLKPPLSGTDSSRSLVYPH